MEKNIIPIGNFNQGGLADSKWSGVANSLYKMLGFDPHSVPGILRVAQKMTKNSGATVTEFCKARLASTNGCTYWGSSTSGKIWERTAAGVWSLVYTVSAGAGGSNILNLHEYQGYIYIATESRLHRIASVHTGSTLWAANMVLNWATFTNTDALYHPMLENRFILFIGDGNKIDQIDGDTFTANAISVKTPLRIKALGRVGTDTLIGTWASDNITKTRLYRWNGWSPTFTSFDEINEVGINAFLESDSGIVYVQAGLRGNIYVYDGEKLKLYKKIMGDHTPTATSLVNPTSVSNLGGEVLFGVSNGTGNPCDQGLYRIGHNSNNYPYIMDLPYPISERNSGAFVLSNIEIGGVLVVGSDVFMAWKRTIPGTPDTYAYGVDMLDYSNKLDGAYYESRTMTVVRRESSNFPEILVPYYLLPANTAISIAYSKNYGAYVDTAEEIDTDRNIVSAKSEGIEASILQIRVTMTASGNTAPEIEGSQVKVG